jgi:hypothetical protein
MEVLRRTVASNLPCVLQCFFVFYVAMWGIQTEAKTQSKLVPAVSNAQIDFAKEYVFAACLVQAYRDTPLAQEANIWAAGVVESSNLPSAVLKPLSELAKKAPPAMSSKPDEVSQKGIPMLLQNCYMWHNSMTVKKAVRSLLTQAH